VFVQGSWDADNNRLAIADLPEICTSLEVPVLQCAFDLCRRDMVNVAIPKIQVRYFVRIDIKPDGFDALFYELKAQWKTDVAESHNCDGSGRVSRIRRRHSVLPDVQ